MAKSVTEHDAKQAIQTLLTYIGEDPTREGLLETPDRILRSYQELYGGYQTDPSPILKTFEDGAQDVDEMIIQRNIPFYSMCEHHMLPFFGVVHIAYLPDKRIIGLSKFARLVDVFARRLQVQERMTVQIADSLMSGLKPKGAGCVIQASHLCMAQRGVAKHGTDTLTSCLRGAFKTEDKTRSEFLNLIRFSNIHS